MRVIQKKICLLGDFAVGKTSLIHRYVDNQFDDRYLSTIGVKISHKSLTIDDYEIQLLIWDLAGGETFKLYQQNYLRGAAGALIVCDLTREKSLEGFKTYTEQYCSANPDGNIVYLANKLDLKEERTISAETLAKFNSYLSSPCQLTSAKTGEGVENSFYQLCKLLLHPYEST